jgi:hypothetical protein
LFLNILCEAQINTDTVLKPQPLFSGIRLILWLTAVLVFIAGIQLYIFSEQTDRYFAWTINPPLTAAFMGAGYWAVFIPSFLALPEREWMYVRGGIIVAFAVTGLILIATLLHLDRLHTGATEFITWLAAWAWIVVYLVVPPLVLVMALLQVRVAGSNPPSQYPLAQWLRAVLLIQGVMTLIPAAAFFLAPETFAPLWPWTLTPFTGRVVGAWLAAVGVMALTLAWENDFARCNLTALAFGIFGLLELVALLRYPNTVEWNEPTAWIWVVLTVSFLAAGVYIWIRGRQLRQIEIREARA